MMQRAGARPVWGNMVWKVGLPLILLAAWQAAAMEGWLHPMFFPSPEMLWRTGMQMVRSGDLGRDLWVTMTRALMGFALGAAPGMGLGVWMGRSPKMRLALEPLFGALNSTPRLVLLPIFMVLLGINDWARVLLVAMGSMVILAMHTLDAVRGVEPAFVEMAMNYGVKGGRLFREIYFPACLPRLFTGVRIALGRALVVEISAELLSATSGLGHAIWLAWQTFAIDRLYVSVLVVAVAGSAIHETLLSLEKRIVPWKI
jgi:ABC-type nitrate/sulfonate/bicarbonate transport system permease component